MPILINTMSKHLPLPASTSRLNARTTGPIALVIPQAIHITHSPTALDS